MRPCSGTVPQVDEIMTAAGPARVVLERQDRPAFLLVLTHGAGGTPDTSDVLAVRDAARALGAVTALVTQPYRVRGGRAPGPAEKQDAAWAELVGALRRETAGSGALQSVIGAPPPSGTFLRLPPPKNASHWLSGEKKA